MQVLLSEKDNIIDKKSSVITSQKRRIEFLEEYLRLEKSKRFASSSEQTTAEQGRLFNEVEATSEPEQEELLPEQPSDSLKAKTGRKPFNKSIPRHQIFAYLSDGDKEGALETFFVKTREELDIIPSKVQILEYMQEKVVFADAEGNRTLKIVEVTKHPVAKAMGCVNLMTYIVIAKYADGLPLYRLENIIKRYGGDISRVTLANCIINRKS
jgi:transposase